MARNPPRNHARAHEGEGELIHTLSREEHEMRGRARESEGARMKGRHHDGQEEHGRGMPHRHPDHPEHHLHKDVHKGHMHPHHEHGAHHDGRERMGRGAYHEGARGAPHEMRGNRGMGEHEPTGVDAADTRPFLIPDYELLPRDDSGGPEWMPYTQEWGDGGYVTGPKAHLTPQGYKVGNRGDTPEVGDEESRAPRSRGEPRPMRGGWRD